MACNFQSNYEIGEISTKEGTGDKLNLKLLHFVTLVNYQLENVKEIILNH